MQNLKHNGQLGFGVLYRALEAHAGIVADKVQRMEKMLCNPRYPAVSWVRGRWGLR